MKRKIKNNIINIIIGFSLTLCMTGCGKTDMAATTVIKTADIPKTTETPSTTISGSFTVGVRDVIPDYCFDNVTPCVAVVTEFQSYPFTIFVGNELGAQLQPDEVYVFSIEPMTVNYSKDELEQLNLSSLVWEIPGFKFTDVRPAEEDELGLSSLQLTFTENE